ncbi:MAG: XRE family transcriptional regulator [Verrucomicrobiaceae bacterium]|nr:MAG: XRE family transcriptional regulator [Verrucomicrobiaceae bacterium]
MVLAPETEFNRCFGESIRHYRQKAGLTQEDLADQAGIHRTYVSLLERGQRSPTIYIVVQLCACMACSPQDLVDHALSVKDGVNA